MMGSSVHAPRRVSGAGRLAAVAVVAALVAIGATGCEPARPDDKSKPVLLIHGWGLGADTDCGSTFNGMIAKLKAAGFTGPFVRVGFYSGGTNCDVNLRSWGPVDDGSHSKVVAQAFSKYVYATYTSKGKAVDVVGYSMGGSVARGAVQGAQAKEAGFSAPINVEDVVLLGAPMNGAAWYSSFCLWGMCSSLKPGSDDVKWMQKVGNPQGVAGTEWTAFGSDADAVTPVDSALKIDVPANRKVRYSDVPHTGSDNYMGRADVVARAATALAKVDS